MGKLPRRDIAHGRRHAPFQQSRFPYHFDGGGLPDLVGTRSSFCCGRWDGAHAAGELASKLAAEGVAHHYYLHKELSPPEAILRAVRDTNTEINNRGKANSEFHNMGTTCSCLIILPQGAVVAHVGDSRVYRLRKHQLEQLTFDHSLVWEMKAAGQIKDSTAASGIPKNVITRSLGPNAEVQVDLEGPFSIQLNDTFLLCSDGLIARVDEDEFGAILDWLSTDEAARFLVDLSNLRGGPDNCTVIVAHVREGPAITGAERVDALTVGTELKPPKTVKPILWVVMIASFVMAAGLFAANHAVPGLFVATIGLAASAIAAYQKFGQFDHGGITLSGGKRLGQAPYAQVGCAPDEKITRRIIQSIRARMDQRKTEDSQLDVSRAAACLDEAQQKCDQTEIADALRLCSVAARILLDN